MRVSLKTNSLIHMELPINTKKYHVFAPMGRFQLESIYLYFPPSSQLLYYICVLYFVDRNTNIIAGTTVENKGKLILTEIFPSVQKHDIF